jgi:cardiolipin synthase
MWLAHALTLSRLPIAAGLVLAYGETMWAVILVVLAAATDAADGRVARWMRRRGSTGPDIGGWLDPLVDKIFVLVVLATIWAHTGDIAVMALIAARELVMAPLVIVYLLAGRRPQKLQAETAGKAATIAQFIACAVAIALPAYALPVAIGAGILGLAAVIDYINRDLRRRSP